jgi:hypothetical protein
MKKIIVIPAVLSGLVLFVGADIRREKAAVPVIPKEPCYGYTIIEFGKGIDCYGDTVKLTKVDGGQERITE